MDVGIATIQPNPDSIFFCKVLDHIQVLEFLNTVIEAWEMEPGESPFKKGDFFKATRWMEGVMPRVILTK